MLMLFWPVISEILHRMRRNNDELDAQRPVE
jgi:hypothetical protein